MKAAWMRRLRSGVVILMLVMAAGFFRASRGVGVEKTPEPWGTMLGAEIKKSGVIVEALPYRGWKDALRISNGQVEAIVVPAIGRVMRFGWVGDKENVLWENAALDGSSAVSADGKWKNFGGDKVWPSPQSQWPQVTGTAWPPPSGFDSMPYTAEVTGDSIVMTSTVDPHYGIQTVRKISLHADATMMTIATEFHKVSGTPVETGVWIIAQVPDAERFYALMPVHSAMGEGYVRLSEAAPALLERSGQLLSLTRNKTENVKIGMDARSMLWVAEKSVLRMDGAAGDGVFPDNGCRTEIYTNADPVPYAEMEVMGPLLKMKSGDVNAWSSTYTLLRRTQPTTDAEAAKGFGLYSPKK